MRATGAGNEPEAYLGQPDPGRRMRDTIMRRQGHFQTPAQRDAMHGRNHDQRGRFYSVAHVRQNRRQLDFPEFLDVCTGDKGASCPDDDDSFDARIVFGLFKPRDEPASNVLAERVDRRMIDFHNGNVVEALIGHLVRHVFASSSRHTSDVTASRRSAVLCTRRRYAARQRARRQPPVSIQHPVLRTKRNRDKRRARSLKRETVQRR